MVIDFRVQPPFKSFLGLYFYRARPTTVDPVKVNAFSIGRRTSAAFVEQSIELFVQEMDDAKIDLSVIMGQHADSTRGSVSNDDIGELIRRYPGRFAGFAGVDPQAPGATDEIRRGVEELGCAGIAILPGWSDPPLRDDDAKVTPLYETANALDVPVMITSSHVIGPDMSYSNPEHIQRVALAFPDLTIIVGHACWPWTTQACALAMRCQNVYLMPEFYMHMPNMPGARDYVDAANGYLSHRMLYSSVLSDTPARAGARGLPTAGNLARVAGDAPLAQRCKAPRTGATMSFAVDAVDAHAEGQHGRVVVGGIGRLAVPGASMFEKMKHLEEHGDWFRLLMLREPRGYPRSCVNVLLPPTDSRADAGFVIMEQSSLFATMSGTNLMVVTTVLLETGMLPCVEPVTRLHLEVPAGLIEVRAHCSDGRVTRVEFENVPSFVTALDVPVEVPGFGTIPVSVAWGGMACAVVDATCLGVDLVPEQARTLGSAMAAVCEAAREQVGFRHPLNDELAEVEATVVMGRPHDPENHARQTAGIPTGQMDTSPSGTGTSAGMAVLHARGQLEVGEAFRTEGLLGGVFHCGIERNVRVGELDAIIPRIGGRAWITGYARYVLQDDDPFPEGFTMGDIWPATDAGSSAERLAAARRQPH